MTVGHSYLPNDRDFGSIEMARRKANHIYVPQDWCDLVRNSRRNNPFTVTAMTREDFVSSCQVYCEPQSQHFQAKS